MNKLNGIILWVDHRDGNAIIKDIKGNEYYTDTSVCKQFAELKYKQAVSFVVSKNVRDCLCARDVELIN